MAGVVVHPKTVIKLDDFLRQWDLILHLYELGSGGWHAVFDPPLETTDSDGDAVSIECREATMELALQEICKILSGDQDLVIADEDSENIDLGYTQVVYHNVAKKVAEPEPESRGFDEDESWLTG